MMKKSCLILFLTFVSLSIYAQETFSDSIASLNKKALIAPALLTAYGASSFFIKPIRDLDIHINNLNRSTPSKNNIDGILTFTPAIAVYGLNAIGIKGKNNWKVQTAHLAIAQVAMNLVVRPTKFLSNRTRPDGSSDQSFPSGHTAIAFVNAEFLWQEYKHRNKWLAASGYAIAATTGVLRMKENEHWFSDVVASAGIAILSTKLTYWAYPKIVKWVKKKK